jgi:hypothetical protein
VGAWIESYDHLVSGWWRAVPRYARLGQPPLVVVLCADAARAQACACEADGLLTATLARIGDDPGAWERPGRERIHFAAELDAHAGRLAVLRVAKLPAALRDPGAGEAMRVELAAIDPAAAAVGTAPPRWR